MSGVQERLVQALEHAEAGQWQRAHEIVQDHEDHAVANWIHALVHRMEGDLDNARYWYGRCGRKLVEQLSIAEELPQVRAALEGRTHSVR